MPFVPSPIFASENKPFLSVDPEWARLKRLQLLRENWIRLMREAFIWKEGVYQPRAGISAGLAVDLKQAFKNFVIWSEPYTTWTSVAGGAFLDQLDRQMEVYNTAHHEVLAVKRARGETVNALPAVFLATVPPRTFSQIMPGFEGFVLKILLPVAALMGFTWVVMRTPWKKAREPKRLPKRFVLQEK